MKRVRVLALLLPLMCSSGWEKSLGMRLGIKSGEEPGLWIRCTACTCTCVHIYKYVY